MNLSGKGVAGAYRAWVREQSLSSATTATATTGRLVVLHDELEKPLGSVTVREQQGLSAKGHNGIKSCLASLGNIPFVRVGVGIGRPLSREPDHVASYVLKKMTPGERQKVEAAAREVMTRLMALKGTR
jgi:PTH1 family peptidyl-tRNA hydrolase